MCLPGGRKSERSVLGVGESGSKTVTGFTLTFLWCYFYCLPANLYAWDTALNIVALLPFHTCKMIWQLKGIEEEKARAQLYRFENTWNISHFMLEYQFQ